MIKAANGRFSEVSNLAEMSNSSATYYWLARCSLLENESCVKNSTTLSPI